VVLDVLIGREPYFETGVELFGIASVDEGALSRALDLGFADFEDAVVHEAAVASGATAIVTRDAKGLRRATLLVYTPVELLAALDSTEAQAT